MAVRRVFEGAALAGMLLLAVVASVGYAVDDSASGTPAKAAAAASLASEQKQIAERFEKLKEKLLRMAELTAATDPRRAALLRKAVAQANDRGIDAEFSHLVELLNEERLAPALKSQGSVHQDLNRLLELLLSEDRSKRIQSEKERIRDYIKRVNKIIKAQKELQGETAGEGDNHKQLGDEQEKLAAKTGELARDIQKNEGSKAGSPNPDDSHAEDQKERQSGDKVDGKDKAEPKGKDQGKNKDADQRKAEDKEKQVGKDKGPAEGKEGPDDDQAEKDKDAKQGDAEQGDAKPEERGQGESKGEGKPAGQDKEKEDGKGKAQPKGEGKGQGQGEGGGEAEQDDAQQPAPAQDENPVQKRIQQAEQKMREAQRKLEQARRHDAVEKQEEAKRELELAKAELEAILRQLREEEVARMLAMLEARFRKMLEAQIDVYEGTKRVDKVPREARDRDHEIEAGRLSRKEAAIVAEADKALIVLHEEGSAVAFPEAVSDLRDDMEQVVVRLAQAKVGQITQGIEEDVIVALEEMIAALQKAQKDLDKKAKSMPAQGGQATEPPLVDAIAEIKMIRSMQMWVNKRTKRYAELTKTEQAEQPELLTALKRLGEREQRIHRITRDIVVGRNE